MGLRALGLVCMQTLTQTRRPTFACRTMQYNFASDQLVFNTLETKCAVGVGLSVCAWGALWVNVRAPITVEPNRDAVPWTHAKGSLDQTP